MRVGSLSKLATREQQARLFASGAMLHAEAMAVSGTGLADLSLERLEAYLRYSVKDVLITRSEDEWTKRLIGLGLMV